LPGTGSSHIEKTIVDTKVPLQKAKDLKEAMELAIAHLPSSGIVLFSPAFASFGLFKNEFDRGDQFNAVFEMCLNRAI